MQTRLILGLSLWVSACEPGEITLVDRSAGSGVQRTVVSVTAKVDLADSALADSLGWQAGVPQAEVFVLRNGTGEWGRFETDSAGSLEITDLLSGLYRVYARRKLSEDEALLVGGVVRAFGDGRTIGVGGKSNLELELLADRPGTLVISEFGNGRPPPWETNGSYSGGLYLEVYNNSNEIVFLDGVILGRTFARGFANSDFNPCSESEPIRTDPEGLYAHWMLAFPGSGSEYPIQPGEVKLVATAAIDHTPVHETLLDLSSADFEIGGGGAANNPAVPDMEDIGLDPWFPGFLGLTVDVYFIARPTDLSLLSVRWVYPFDGRVFLRIPADSLLDVTAIARLFPEANAETPPCTPMINRRFNRYEGGFQVSGGGSGSTQSLERHPLRVTIDGRVILQNTRTSGADFFIGSRTPGRLPNF